MTKPSRYRTALGLRAILLACAISTQISVAQIDRASGTAPTGQAETSIGAQLGDVMTKEKALAVADLSLVVKRTGLSYNVGFKPKPCKSYAIRPDYASACEVRAALVGQLSTFVERWDLIQGGKAA